MGLLWQLSWTVALSVLIPLALGLFVDRQLGTSPLFTLAAALLGIVGGTVAAVRVALRAIADSDKPATAEDKESNTGKEHEAP